MIKEIKMSKENFLKLYDTVTFSFLDPSLIKVKDNYEGAFKPQVPGQTHPSGMGTVMEPSQQSTQSQTKGLLVKIAATHAGIITRNNGFYLPDKMKKGASSFIEDFNKPILLHHNDEKDPIGRVIQSSYVDMSGAIVDSYGLAKGLKVKNKHGREVGTINDALIKDFCSSKMPMGMQIDTVLTLLKDSLLEDEGYAGLGYVSLLANVTDEESIQKLLDGRYLTGSVGATTNQAICSVCRQDWTEDGRCDHNPGAVYDGSKCFIIAGDLKYEEYSFVNKPADRQSKVLELHYNGVRDSIETVDEYKSRIYESVLNFPQYDSVQETIMADLVVNKAVETEIVVQDSVEVKETEVLTVTEQVVVEQAPVVEALTQQEGEKTLEETTTKNVESKEILDEKEKVLLSGITTKLMSLLKEENSEEVKTLKNEITNNEKEIGELRATLDSLRNEYKALIADMEVIKDSLITANLSLRKAKESHLSTLSNLKDAQVKERNFSTIEDNVLDNEIDQTLKSIDMIAITDKLGDGMSNIPKGEVEDPSMNLQDEAKVQKSGPRLDMKMIEEINAKYLQLRFTDGSTKAEAFRREMQLKGFLPRDNE